MVGGTGNDTYTVDDASDLVTESASSGTDLVQTSVTYTLTDNVENLTLLGSSALNGTGNSIANVMTGNSANNIFAGNSGNDSISGGEGHDLLSGGTGNDVLTGGADNDDLSGDEGDDTLSGGAGIDSLNADIGEGDDLLQGGADSDDYIINWDDSAEGLVTISDEGGSTDSITIYAVDIDDLTFSAIDTDSDTNMDALTIENNGIILTIENYFDDTSPDVTLSGSGSGEIETLEIGVYTLDFDEVVEIVDTGEVGPIVLEGTNADDNIQGNNFEDDEIYGFNGNDTLSGFGGNDTVYGGAGSNRLEGGEGNDVLSGGTGEDLFFGGDGNDGYLIDDDFYTGFINDNSGAEDYIEFDLSTSSVTDVGVIDYDADEVDYDLLITFSGSILNPYVILYDYFGASSADEGTGCIESISFSNAVTWTFETVQSMLP